MDESGPQSNTSLDKCADLNLPRDVMKSVDARVLQTTEAGQRMGVAKDLQDAFRIDRTWVKTGN
jgi:hypothetical protein